MSVVAREQRLDRVWPHLFVTVGGDFVQIDEGYVFGLGQFARPLAVAARAAFDATVFPDIADGEREQDRAGTLPLHVGEHLTEIPAEGVYGLVLFGDEVVDFLRFVAEAGE